MHKKQLIIVEWDDTTGSSAWVSEEGVKKTEPFGCTSVGWKLKSTPKKLVICASKNDVGDYADRNTIPKGCIKSIRRLECVPQSVAVNKRPPH